VLQTDVTISKQELSSRLIITLNIIFKLHQTVHVHFKQRLRV